MRMRDSYRESWRWERFWCLTGVFLGSTASAGVDIFERTVGSDMTRFMLLMAMMSGAAAVLQWRALRKLGPGPQAGPLSWTRLICFTALFLFLVSTFLQARANPA